MDRLLDQCRKRMGKSFRKSLGMFNYKVKEYGIGKIRKPGVIPLDTYLKHKRVMTEFLPARKTITIRRWY